MIKTIQSEDEKKNRIKLKELFQKNPIFENEIVSNVGVFLKRQELSKILF